ncbi:MAG TPA: RcnB family protein [Rhizomicrobium sp.]|nr:RcnB family protein [Rhizomicrobium sp.]
MNRSFIPAFGLGLALIAAPAVAQNRNQDRNDVDKRVLVHKGHETVRRTVTERPNGTDVRRTVTERPNGAVVNRTVRERPNGNVRVTRKVIRPAHRYHVNRTWVAPRGFVFRHFRLGERVPTVLLASEYFLLSPWLYGLEAAPYGYVWIREGSDAVLVDRYTGAVVQVAYDVFY